MSNTIEIKQNMNGIIIYYLCETANNTFIIPSTMKKFRNFALNSSYSSIPSDIPFQG